MITKNSHRHQRILKMERCMPVPFFKQDTFQAMVHDLKAPMTVIKGYLKLLLSGMAGPMSEEQKLLLQRSVRPLEELIQMTDNLLQSVTLQQEDVELQREKVDLDSLLEEVIDFYKVAFEERKMQLYREGNTLGIQLEVDPFWLKRVLSNLIWNAFKFTPDRGQVKILVEKEGTWVRISVVDTGRGIPPEKLGGIFEKYGQANRGSDAHFGTGLGLWICRRVMELHGGRITVESEVNQGSRFTLWIPFRETH